MFCSRYLKEYQASTNGVWSENNIKLKPWHRGASAAKKTVFMSIYFCLDFRGHLMLG